MAEKKLFTVRDAKAEIYGPPIIQLTHAEAERTFTRMANDSSTQIGQYPEDYDLYHLGTFDDATGKFETLQTPQHLIKAVDVVKKPIGGLNASANLAPVNS